MGDPRLGQNLSSLTISLNYTDDISVPQFSLLLLHILQEAAHCKPDLNEVRTWGQRTQL